MATSRQSNSAGQAAIGRCCRSSNAGDGTKDDAVIRYQRRIAMLAMIALEQSGYHELRSITCNYRYQDGVLLMRGKVSSFYMKQIAQTVVGFVEQVYEIRNEVDVIYPTEESAF